jgi:hypothetical protein
MSPSSDKEFRLRGGGTQQASVYNRIQAISRIEHLAGVDLRKKSKYYLFALDMEMYQRWYKNYPKDHRIDEEWCKRAAEIVKSMEEDEGMYEQATDLAGITKKAFEEHEALPLKEPEVEKKKESWLNKLPWRKK